MTLTVRLKPELESALELHCAERGVTKSLVVQEVLAEYLARPEAMRRATRGRATELPAEPSANYRAFAAAGFIGSGRCDGRSADKATVREVIARRLAERQRRRARR
jgi:hypothetical protein